MIKLFCPQINSYTYKAVYMIKHFDIQSPLFSHLMGVLSHFHLSAIMKKLGFYKEKGVRPVAMVVHMIMSLLTCGSFKSVSEARKI